MRFNDKWRSWVAEYLRTASISVLVNDSPTKEFGMGREMRQEDPMSPFPYLLASEGLNQMTTKSANLKLFERYRWWSEGVCILHIQFADDTLIVGEKS
jgi:hypothetical protein